MLIILWLEIMLLLYFILRKDFLIFPSLKLLLIKISESVNIYIQYMSALLKVEIYYENYFC